MAVWTPTDYESVTHCNEKQSIILPLDGGGLRRELSRTIKVGGEAVHPPHPTLSHQRLCRNNRFVTLNSFQGLVGA